MATRAERKKVKRYISDRTEARFSKSRVFIWSSNSEILESIEEEFLKNFKFNQFYCLPLSTKSPGLFYSERRLLNYSDHIEEKKTNQIHIILFEFFNQDLSYSDLLKECDLRLHSLFFLSLLCVNPRIEIIICGLPVNVDLDCEQYYLFHYFNKECKNIISRSATPNFKYFDTNSVFKDFENNFLLGADLFQLVNVSKFVAKLKQAIHLSAFDLSCRKNFESPISVVCSKFSNSNSNFLLCDQMPFESFVISTPGQSQKHMLHYEI
jgi:hypothetical protein